MPSPEIAPGQVWWCDGAALSFEAHFKRRPVLILDIQGGLLRVAPLSSKRRHGQEQQVTHTGGVSYLTGQIAEVPAVALLTPLSAWDGFARWRAEQEQAAAATARWQHWLRRLRGWLGGV